MGTKSKALAAFFAIAAAGGLSGCIAVPVEPAYYPSAPAYYPAPVYYPPPVYYGPSFGIGVYGSRGWHHGGRRWR